MRQKHAHHHAHSEHGHWKFHRFARGRGHGRGGPMGIRRPLRFFAHKLGLEEGQVAKFAAILDNLKIERAQADVDVQRSKKLYAEAVSGDVFDAELAKKASDQRVASAARVQEAVTQALQQLHGLLNAGQREKLSMLIRMGPLTL